MDWSRAKTILIVVFLTLNIFLLYNLFIQENSTTSVTQKDVADTKAILAARNIDLKAQIPSKIKRQSFLKVEDAAYKEQDLVKNLLGPGSTKENGTDRVSVYKNGDIRLEIYPNKRVVFTQNPADNIAGYNKNKVIKYVENYLKYKGIDPKFGVVDKFVQSPEGYEISFRQDFKGVQVFGSRIDVSLSNKGITKVDALWYTPIGFTNAPMDIKTPMEVLLLFANDLANKNKVAIDSITLGYYLPPEETNNASIEAVPVWKIGISTEEIFYYNAYEGYLENKVTNK